MTQVQTHKKNKNGKNSRKTKKVLVVKEPLTAEFILSKMGMRDYNVKTIRVKRNQANAKLAAEIALRHQIDLMGVADPIVRIWHRENFITIQLITRKNHAGKAIPDLLEGDVN